MNNALLRLKFTKTSARSSMHAAPRLKVPDNAKNGFERASGLADEVK